ncbi:hypothetical protein SBA7_960002 [Candidatus Sulfotelmatobacter sp. SbA7]|nr:hypothetical protein SBA7_960002 [Candidatus Sulfotelmatobacter sp. SbA7]
MKRSEARGQIEEVEGKTPKD